MKTIAALVVLAVLGTSSAWGMTAEEIIEKVWVQYSAGVQEEVEFLEATLLQGERTQKKIAIRKTKFLAGGNEINVSFSAPIADVGTELRVLQKATTPDIIYLKMKSWSKERRISGSQLTSPFIWEITREDTNLLSGENTKMFQYNLMDDLANAWIIQALPRSGTDSGYTERRIWVDKKTFAVKKVEYYKKGGLEKIQQTGTVKVINSTGAWRVDQIIIDNLKRNRTMTIVIQKREINL